MSSLKQIRRLLNPSQPNNGTLIKKSNGSLLVATRNGTQTFQQSGNDANQYRTGDTVAIVNGVIVGKRNRNPTVYVI